jgi:hypothetical protein
VTHVEGGLKRSVAFTPSVSSSCIARVLCGVRECHILSVSTHVAVLDSGTAVAGGVEGVISIDLDPINHPTYMYRASMRILGGQAREDPRELRLRAFWWNSQPQHSSLLLRAACDDLSGRCTGQIIASTAVTSRTPASAASVLLLVPKAAGATCKCLDQPEPELARPSQGSSPRQMQ